MTPEERHELVQEIASLVKQEILSDPLVPPALRALEEQALFDGLQSVMLGGILASYQTINQERLPVIALKLYDAYKRVVNALLPHAFTDAALGFAVADEESETHAPAEMAAPAGVASDANTDTTGTDAGAGVSVVYPPLPAAETRWYYVTGGTQIGVFNGPEEAMHYSQGVTGGAMGRAASRDAAIRRVRQAITSGHAKLVLPK